jgi:hypothetical protein
VGVETKPGLGVPANPVSVDTADPADPADPPQPARPGRRVPRPALSELVGLVGLALVLVAMALVLVNNIEDHPQLSYLDEVGNADYLFQASHGGMAQLGERLGPEITKETACRGIQLQPPMDVPCPGDGDPAKVPGWDVTNTDIHPPTYYYATFGISKAILLVAPTDSLVTAGRLANIVWLGLGLVLVYLLLRDLRVNVPARLAVCLLIALCPSVVQHMSIVNVTATYHDRSGAARSRRA